VLFSRNSLGRKVAFKIAIVLGFLAVEALLASVSPTMHKFHWRTCYPGTILVRAFHPYDPFVPNPIGWLELSVNAAVYCVLALPFAVTLSTRHKWRDTTLLVHAVLALLVLAGWQIPHNIVRLSGKQGGGILLFGDGTLVTGFKTDAPDAEYPENTFETTFTQPFPGIRHLVTLGPDVGTTFEDFAVAYLGPPEEARLVRDHTYTISLWVFFIPLAVYPLVAWVVHELRPRKYIVCEHCGYNLTGLSDPRCPGCKRQNPNVSGTPS